MTENERADLLYGAAAIAEYLDIGLDAARHRIRNKLIPTFKMGGTVCARRSAIDAALNKAERKEGAPDA